MSDLVWDDLKCDYQVSDTNDLVQVSMVQFFCLVKDNEVQQCW